MFRAASLTLALLFGGCATLPGYSSGLSVAEEPFLTFSRDAAFGQSSMRVEVRNGFLADQARQYWIQRTTKTGRVTAIDWADTISCPDARAAIDRVTEITPPRIRVPGQPMSENDAFVIITDGIGYEINASAHYAGQVGSDIRFSSNIGTPLAEWVEESLDILAKCWRKDRLAR